MYFLQFQRLKVQDYGFIVWCLVRAASSCRGGERILRFQVAKGVRVRDDKLPQSNPFISILIPFIWVELS
jgi:hypothetical protein